jgi:hypothetical protein
MSRGGKASRNIANGQQLSFIRIQTLPSGIPKGVHGSKEGRNLVEGGQQHFSIIGKLEGGEVPASHRDANAARLEEAKEGLRKEEVKEGRQGAPLANTSSKGCRGRNVAIHHGPGPRIMQQQADHGQKAFTHTKFMHGTEQEFPVKGVVSLSEVAENHNSTKALAAQQVGQALQSHDILTNLTPRHKGSLLPIDDATEANIKAQSQYLGKEAIIGAKKGNGAVVGWVAALTALVDNGDEPLMEAGRQGAQGGDGSEEAGEEGGEDGLELAVQLHRQAIVAGGLARGRRTQRPQHLGGLHRCGPKLLSLGGTEAPAGGQRLQHLLPSSRVNSRLR